MMKPLGESTAFLILSIGVLVLTGATAMQAAPQQGPPRTEDRVSGTVRSVDAGRKTVTIQSRGVRTPRRVRYDGNTKLTNRDNQPVAFDTLKKGQSLACVGHLEEDQRFAASVCTLQ